MFRLKWNRLVVSLPSFEHFMASLIFIVYKSIDFVKHKQVKISDKKEQRFGDIVTPF